MGTMRSRVWVLLALAAVVILALGYHQNSGSAKPAGGQTSSSGRLPPEAIQTIRLIDEGGPFPYPRDGAVFMNREGMLPQHPDGYWHEYTVQTPGESDRGARRIIHGAGGEFYYTGNHYASFSRVTARQGGGG